MSMLSVYVNANGDVARDVFNAIAMFMATSTFSSALTIAVMCSILVATLTYIKTRDVMIFVKWFALYFIITAILMTPKVDIEIIDTSHPGAITVDNMPYGIAAPAGFISGISHALTQTIEDIFHLPDDVSYSKSGMLFGSRIFELSTTVGLQDDHTKHLFDLYLQNCILPDISIGKYTWSDLAKTPDIWQFLTSVKQSPLRGIIDNGVFETCATAFPRLKQAVSMDASNNTIKLFGTRLFGGDAMQAELKMKSALPNIYQYFTTMSQTASDILIQNMTINALRNGIQNYAAYTGATGAMQNYSDAKQMNNLTLANFNASNQAFYMLPLMQTVLFLLICCLFPIVVLLSLQPGFGLVSIKSFFYSIIYVCSWPLLFAILNYMMNSALYFATVGMADHGITLSDANPLAVEHVRFAGYAGYMILAIPIITIWITKGLAQGMSQAAQYIGGMAHSIAGQVASETSSGNISLANASIGNSSYNNLSANKHDTNSTDFSGMKTTQLPNGGTMMTAPDGRVFYNTGSSVSQLPVSLHFSQALSHSQTVSAERYKQQAHHEQTSFNQSISRSAGQFEQFSESLNQQTLEGMGYSENDSRQMQNAMHRMDQIASDISHRTGMSHQDSVQHMFSLTGGLSASGSVSGPIPFIKSIPGISNDKVSTGASLGGQGSVEWKRVGYDDDVKSKSDDAVVSSKEMNDFSSSLNTLQTIASNHHIDDSHSKGSSYLSQMLSDFREAETAAKNYAFDEQQATRFSESASRINQQGDNITASFMPAFQDYVVKEVGAYSADVLFRNSTTPANIDRLHSLANGFIDSIKSSYSADTDAKLANPGFVDYQQESGVVYGQYSQHVVSGVEKSHAELQSMKNKIEPVNSDKELKNTVKKGISEAYFQMDKENVRLQSLVYADNKITTDKINEH